MPTRATRQRGRRAMPTSPSSIQAAATARSRGRRAAGPATSARACSSSAAQPEPRRDRRQLVEQPLQPRRAPARARPSPRSANARVEAVASGDEAVLRDPPGRRDGELLAGLGALAPASVTSACTTAATAAVSPTVVCASATRTSIVPNVGCSRSSHHQRRASGSAPALAPHRSARSNSSQLPSAGGTPWRGSIAAMLRPHRGQPAVAPLVERRVGGERGELGQVGAQRVVHGDARRPRPRTVTWTCRPKTSWRRAMLAYSVASSVVARRRR